MPSAIQMAAAEHGPWMTAATEHSPEVPLLQSTGMSANVRQCPTMSALDWQLSSALVWPCLFEQAQIAAEVQDDMQEAQLQRDIATLVSICGPSVMGASSDEEEEEEVEVKGKGKKGKSKDKGKGKAKSKAKARATTKAKAKAKSSSSSSSSLSDDSECLWVNLAQEVEERKGGVDLSPFGP